MSTAKFRKDLSSFVPLIKSTAQVTADHKAIEDYRRTHSVAKIAFLPVVGVNIAFSHFDFTKVGIAVLVLI